VRGRKSDWSTDIINSVKLLRGSWGKGRKRKGGKREREGGDFDPPPRLSLL